MPRLENRNVRVYCQTQQIFQRARSPSVEHRKQPVARSDCIVSLGGVKGYKMNQIEIDTVGGFCPCQANGTFYGNPFYFRARNGEWTIEVARPGSDPICNPELFFMEGDDPDEGYMEVHDAMKEIGRAFEAFTRKYIQQIIYGQPWPDIQPPNVRDHRAGPDDPSKAEPSDVAGSGESTCLAGPGQEGKP
jgi:hypothetical protein